MYNILQDVTGLDFSQYDKVIVFMFVALVCFLLFDVCYTILLRFFDFVLGKRW